MQNKIFFIIFLSISIISGILLINKLSKSDILSKFNFEFLSSLNSISNFAKDINKPNLDSKDSLQDLDTIIGDIEKDEVNINQNKPELVKQPDITLKSNYYPKSGTDPITKYNVKNSKCNTFSILRNNGTFTTYCYSTQDYNKLLDLDARLFMVQTDLDVEKRVLETNTKFYEKYKTDNYLEEINKSKKKMQEYQDLIGDISLQMYNIESRGY